MKRCFFGVCFVLVCTAGDSQQSLQSPLTSPASSSYETDRQDLRGVAINPATLAFITEPQVTVGSERKYFLKELSGYSSGAAMPLDFGGLALIGDYLGSGMYNESELSLSYGRKLTDFLAIGAAFNYRALKLAGYGKASAIGAAAGLLIRLSEKCLAGITVINPVAGKFGKIKVEKLPFECRLGMGYSFSPTCFISAELIKEEDIPVNGRFLVQYRFVNQCMARFGVNTALSSFWTGLGFGLGEFSVEPAIAYHVQLGLTPGLSMLYKIKGAKE